MVGLIMASLETQYRMFIKYNPEHSDCTYPEWLKWQSTQIAEAIETIELYQSYRDQFIGYEYVPDYDWFINELKTNEKFRNKYGKSNT